MTERVQRAIDWVKAHEDDAPTWGGVFDTKGIAGDRMYSVYARDNINIDACYDWGYIEVFGMTDEEFAEFRDEVEVDPLSMYEEDESDEE